jgi:hypothetical protein
MKQITWKDFTKLELSNRTILEGHSNQQLVH